MSCSLVVDTRERHVYRHSVEFAEITHRSAQITTGDYAVLDAVGNIAVIIERKSLEDYAASIKDGRHSNKEKLIRLRAEVGCRIMYIIEGSEFPAPDRQFGGIPYRYIESSIFHLMVRDGIVIMRTRDSLDTAKTLVRFMKSMDNLKLDEVAVGGTGENIITEVETIAEATETATSMALLLKKQGPSEQDILRAMWAKFKGITTESADEYIRHWSLADIIGGTVSTEIMSATKLSSGRRINKRVVESLKDWRGVALKLLAAIPGVSAGTAQHLLITPLSVLINHTETELAVLPINDKGRKVGPKLAASITKYFYLGGAKNN